MFRRVGTLAVLAAAAGGPYVATETDWGRTTSQTFVDLVQPATDAAITRVSGGDDYANHSHYEVETLRPADPSKYRYDEELARKLGALPSDPSATPSLVGMQTTDLRQVLRFDIDTHWVLNRFSRVTTVLSDMNLEALRVPVVTGTKAVDVAGTLTYFFDRSGKVQRIQVHGFVGDPRQIVTTMASDYGLATEASLEAGAYTRRWNGVPIHFLRLTHAPVVYSDAAHQKYTLFLELNQPNLAYGISQEARRIVTSDHYSGRW